MIRLLLQLLGDSAKRFAEHDPRFRLFTQPNGGLGKARNTGADAASGEYLAFVDSDDVLPLHAYELLLGALEKSGSDFATGNVHRFTSAGTKPAWFLARAFSQFLYVESCNQCPACKNGLRTASSAIDELFDPKLATPDDFERAFYGAHRAPQGNRCYLPVQGSVLIPSLIERFPEEFDKIARSEMEEGDLACVLS